MIQQNSTHIKAVGMISGGLDSTLAAKIIKDLGVEVYGVYFAMPWGCCDKTKAIAVAQSLEINFITLQLDERYLEMVRKPKHGYGSVLNPCVDCRIHMFRRAGEYMKEIGADFVFTGEVLGQRNMSQLKHSLKWVEVDSGLEGRLLRPLSAQNLEPTIPEKLGLIDRTKLLSLTGRSRKPQIKMAADYGITDYPQPMGGCLLTEEPFANRMKDTLKYGYRDFRETIALKWGRHFRIDENTKIILGRDEEENNSLIRHAHMDDYIMQFTHNRGPTVILKGNNISEEKLSLAAGLLKYFSKHKNDESIDISYWKANDRNNILKIQPKKVDDTFIEQTKV